jgi:glycosyltransferase involved in cell wall biosynthesis
MLRKTNILINASNLHAGGGLQVAVSFIYEIDKLKKYNLDLIVSESIHNELTNLEVKVVLFRSYKVFNSNGMLILFNSKFQNLLRNYDTVFTIFGPLYCWKKPKKSVVGFAQPWIIYPNNEIYLSYDVVQKFICSLKYSIQWFFYKRSDRLIVELDHVKNRLLELFNVQDTKINVVNNCVSSLFFDTKKWTYIDYNLTKSDLILGIVSRDYPHKNLKILPEVASILNKKYNISIKFLITLNDEEWMNNNFKIYKCIYNVGSIKTDQCPAFYNLLDGVIFPSLLECFSATPIEAMIMKKPVFASDRLFVKQACDNFVNYFDPSCSNSIASCIYKYYYQNQLERSLFVDKAYNHALKYNNPSERAIKYINQIGFNN